MFFASALLLAAPVALAAGVDRLATRQSACADTHVFLAKGNNEPYPGRQGKLVNAICSGLASCDYEDIQFYNPVESPYCGSVNEGVANGIAQITAYNQRCPEAKLVLSGYSQGAQIVSDILAGGGGTFFQGCVQTTSAGIDINSAAGRKIAAAMVFGDLRHTANQPYNVLSGAGGQGLFPRSGSQAAALLTYTSVFHDYCVANDPICAGGKVVADHLNYFDIYTDEAAAWVKSQLLKAPSGSAPPPPPPPPATVTPSPSVSVAPYPTSAYSNGTYPVSSYTAIMPIPTATNTIVVTVPCVTLAPSMVASYTSKYLVAVPTTLTNAPGHATTAAIVPVYPTTIPTGTPSNGTVPVTGGAQGLAFAPVAAVNGYDDDTSDV
ncbi:related to acetylxylan esterase precursor [Rhynchosporium graminicola]|uniref:Cutinase n=1 Tax=Rhynchosporium graminicola TaxID=2792576 RepID=A0A1E1K7Q9_9HELO|nr:related to acetylxylan esterase precursor [Rhynchosporium commune]